MKCLLDLDGVLVDFVKGACKAHGCEVPNPWPGGHYGVEDLLGLDSNKFWGALRGFDFWANLDWMPDGREILLRIESYFDQREICILSSPTYDPQAAAGKMAWIQKHLPSYSRQFLIGPAKEFCAAENHVLIDDYDSNINKFVEAGGYGILVPRQWNGQHNLSDRVMDVLRLQLGQFTGSCFNE